jgi:hypothetical protein
MCFNETQIDLSGKSFNLLRTRLTLGKETRSIWILAPKNIDPTDQTAEDLNNPNYRYYLHRYTSVQAFEKVQAGEETPGLLGGCSFDTLLDTIKTK